MASGQRGFRSTWLPVNVASGQRGVSQLRRLNDLRASHLRDHPRFAPDGSVFRLDYYDRADMEIVAGRSAKILGLSAESEGISEIASRARGTPRVANRLLKRARDYALVAADNHVSGQYSDKISLTRFHFPA